MEIDFTATEQDGNVINYLDQKGKIVKSVLFTPFYEWAYKEYWNVQESKMERYIDDNWQRLTKEYFNTLPTPGYVARLKPQQTQNQLR